MHVKGAGAFIYEAGASQEAHVLLRGEAVSTYALDQGCELTIAACRCSRAAMKALSAACLLTPSWL